MIGIVTITLNCLEMLKSFSESWRTSLSSVKIIVDNGSSEDVKGWAESEGYVYVRLNENKGIAAGWNAGVRKALELGCTNIVLVHNDVILHRNAIDNLVRCYDENKQWLPLLSGVDQKGYWLPDSYFKEPPSIEDVDATPLKHGCVGSYALFSFFSISKETIDLVGFFDENFFPGAFMDDDYRYRIKISGKESASCPCAFHWHWGGQTFHRNNISMHRDYIDGREYYLKKWGGGPLEEKYRKPFNKD